MTNRSLPRILLISRQKGLGGTERRLTDLALDLESKKFVIEIFFTINNQNSNTVIEKFKKTPFGRILYIWFKLLKFKPDIVHAFDLETGIYTYIARLISTKKFKLVSGYGAGIIQVKSTKFLLKKGWFLANLYICNSEKAIQSLKSYLNLPEKIELVRNGLDSKRLDGKLDIEVDMLLKARDRNIIGYIGKFNDEKHAERIFYLAKYFYENYPALNLFFVIIGDGPYRQDILNRISTDSNNLKDSIYMPGEIKDAGILAKRFNIGLLCSDTEGFPNVLIEYMYFGVPWISTDVGDVSFILEKGNCGFVIKKWSLEEFSHYINFLLSNHEIFKNMSNEGKRIFDQEFKIERMCNEYINYYTNL
jgi:glycosyltransferase involved in cell wall biosynthesis